MATNDEGIDYWRQLDIFSPDSFKTPITVIGAGATGSYIVWLLAKMGCRDITVYDFDDIENHNPPNQIYGRNDCGQKKVIALGRIIWEATGIMIKTITKPFTAGSLKGIVFVLTDTMESRKQIWDSSIKLQLGVELLIETRMDARGGFIYTVRPSMPKHIDGYNKKLYSDKDAEESACTNRAIAPTVAIIAGYAVSLMIDFVNKKPIYNETILSFSPLFTRERNF